MFETRVFKAILLLFLAHNTWGMHMKPSLEKAQCDRWLKECLPIHQMGWTHSSSSLHLINLESRPGLLLYPVNSWCYPANSQVCRLDPSFYGAEIPRKYASFLFTKLIMASNSNKRRKLERIGNGSILIEMCNIECNVCTWFYIDDIGLPYPYSAWVVFEPAIWFQQSPNFLALPDVHLPSTDRFSLHHQGPCQPNEVFVPSLVGQLGVCR